MSGIDKKACRNFLEPILPPNSDCGLFLVPNLKYIVRTVVKMIGHRRLLVLCLYARGDTPGGSPKLTYTVFQACDSFVTYDHRPGKKTLWRTAMLENLETDNYFLSSGCAFYSRQDETRVISFCKPYVNMRFAETGFDAISSVQQQIRDQETLLRQKNRERRTKAKLSGLPPLPCDLGDWLKRKVLPAYFFYDFKKGPKKLTQGICSACGQKIELIGAKYNATGVCPLCGRELTMKANGKRGRIWDRVTASVIQKYRGDKLIVRVIKAYLSHHRDEGSKLDWYEEIRIIVDSSKDSKNPTEVFHDSSDSVGITTWKTGYPPALYLYQENFIRDTCGYLYCKNLNRALKGTVWQYCQLSAFYEGIHNQMEVAPYLCAYLKIPAIEFFVKLKLFWLATYVVYARDGEKVICPQGKNLREVLQIDPSDLPLLQQPGVGIHDLQVLRALRAGGHQPSAEFFAWLRDYDFMDTNRLERGLRYTTPHKLMRYLNLQFSKVNKNSYRRYIHVLSDYDDYLGFCEELEYDLKSEFVLFPKNFKLAHDRAQNTIKLHNVEQYDQQIALMQEELKRQYHFKADGLEVLPPQSAREIVLEGQKLHHCVGGYVQSVINKKCVILFIRKGGRRNKPFYTVEVRGNRIFQVRGANNRDPVPEVQDFLSKWEKKRHLEAA